MTQKSSFTIKNSLSQFLSCGIFCKFIACIIYMRASIKTFFQKARSKGEKTPSSNKKQQQKYLPQDPTFLVLQQYQQDQIVDSLIGMSSHIKITIINRELQGQYVTLCYINRMLCQQVISAKGIRHFLCNKCSQSLEKEVRDRSGSYQPIRNALMSYMQFSNGLIYQYYSVRALLWKIALGHLPCNKNKWISLMQGSLLKYQTYIRDHLGQTVLRKRNRKIIVERQTSPEQRKTQQKKHAMDHPLNRGKDSKWKTYFQDTQLWNLIQKDTIRTKPKCNFFRNQFDIQIGSQALLKTALTPSQYHLSKIKDKTQTYYHDAVTRIIYIFLKTHPQITYCQGMNQIAALVFYSFANKNSEYFRRVAQSDTYFCFEMVMKCIFRFQGSFMTGQKYASRFEDLLKKIDLRLYQSLQTNPANLQALKMLSIKWFNSFYLNEFQIDECLILWDAFISLFGKDYQNNFQGMRFDNLLLSIALAIVHLSRSQLSQGRNPLQLLAKIPHSPQSMLEKAFSLYKIFTPFFQ